MGGLTNRTISTLQADLDNINKVCRELHTEVNEFVLFWMKQGKKLRFLVAIILRH